MTTPSGLSVSSRHEWDDRDEMHLHSTSYWMNASSMAERDGILQPISFPGIARFALYRSTLDRESGPFQINVTECSLNLTAYEYTNARANDGIFEFEDIQEVDVGDENLWLSRLEGVLSILYLNGSEEDGIPALEVAWSDVGSLQTFFESEAMVNEYVEGDWPNDNPGLSAALIGDVDLEERFEQMATSLTDYLRSGPNRQLASGVRLENEPFVSVRWGYMAGPLAIEVAALLFAAFAIAANRASRKVPLWKSSALAVLACQHDDKLQLIESKLKDMEDIQKKSEEALVKLE